MKPPKRDEGEILDADLISYLQAFERANSMHPPAEVRKVRNKLEEILRARQQAHRDRILANVRDFEAERLRVATENVFSMGTPSDSGIHDVRPLQQALAAREAAKALEAENALLREKDEKRDARDLKIRIKAHAVTMLITAAGIAFVWLLREYFKTH